MQNKKEIKNQVQKRRRSCDSNIKKKTQWMYFVERKERTNKWMHN